MIIEGNVAFSNVTEMDVFNGQSTGKYSLTVTLDSQAADGLTEKGVKVKTYTPEEGEARLQRKFSTKHRVQVVNTDDSPFNGEIPRGSLVRIKYSTGNEHPVHGVPVYLNKVRVLEIAEYEGDDDEDF